MIMTVMVSHVGHRHIILTLACPGTPSARKRGLRIGQFGHLHQLISYVAMLIINYHRASTHLRHLIPVLFHLAYSLRCGKEHRNRACGSLY